MFLQLCCHLCIGFILPFYLLPDPFATLFIEGKEGTEDFRDFTLSVDFALLTTETSEKTDLSS